MASTYLTRTQGTGTSTKIATFSVWLKKAENGSSYEPHIFDSFTDSSNRFSIGFEGDYFLLYNFTSGSNDILLKSNRVFRDNNAFYNLVVKIDTTQATSSDRVKIWINGIEETSFSSSTYPSQNLDIHFLKSSSGLNIGRYGGNTNAIHMFNGVMSHMHFIDGTAYDASAFGETDATTGEWKINTSPSVTYGTNGYFILKDGNSVTDQSGNGNNFTVGGGTLTNTEDNPSNVFATLNPLVPDAGSSGLYHGNNQFNVDTANWRSAFSTLGMSSGKFYFESQIQAGGYIQIGARGVEQSDGSLAGNNDWIGVTSQGWSYDKAGEIRNNNSGVDSGKATYGNTDIIGCLLDLDNWTINWTKNGTLINSTAYSITQNLTYVFGVSGHSTARILTNFGNGNFSSTAISSAGTNASGNGIFEFDVPTGYTALSTKGLNL